MKNSTLLLPARFLCNMCIEENQNDLYHCHNDQIPLESIKSAKSLCSYDQIINIQKVIYQSFKLFKEDMASNEKFYFNDKEACIDKAS